jgi:hypothetical protein
MHRQCGCRTAQQCWRGCCCFTNRQKLAWAKQNGVKAPEFVAVAAKREQKKAVASCCSTKKVGVSALACQQPAKDRLKPELQRNPLRFISVIQALSCQGHVEQWVAIGAIDVVAPELWQVELPLTGTVSVVSESSDSRSVAPASPPPWRWVV